MLSRLIGARGEEGDALTDEELRDQLVTLLLAGHETTATALAWRFTSWVAIDRPAGVTVGPSILLADDRPKVRNITSGPRDGARIRVTAC